MKFIIRQILFALALIAIIHESQCRRSIPKDRLSHLVNLIIELKEDKPQDNEASKFFEGFNIDCMKNYLKVPQSDKILINGVENMIFIVGASLKCSDENIAFNYLFNSYIRPKFEKWIDCFEWHLKQLEPESKLIENIATSEVESDECKKRFSVEEMKEEQKIYFENILGPLDVYSCGAVTGANDFIKFISKGALIQFGNKSEELKKSEKEKLKEYLKDISFRTIECFFKRFESDSKALLINDTLSYYFKEAIEPIETTKNPYVQKSNSLLKKIFDNIDLNCTKEQLNLPENGEITLLEIEAKILIGSAMSKCIKVDNYDFANILLDYGINEDDKTEDDVYCSKFLLQKLEPESKLAKISITKVEVEKICESYPNVRIIPFTPSLRKYKASVGELKATTCDALSDEFVKMFSYKAVLVATEKDMELKRSESKELFTSATEKLHKLADCILNRVK